MKKMKLKEAMVKTFKDIREACVDVTKIVPTIVSWLLFFIFLSAPTIIFLLVNVYSPKPLLFGSAESVVFVWFVSQLFWGAFWYSVRLYMVGNWR